LNISCTFCHYEFDILKLHGGAGQTKDMRWPLMSLYFNYFALILGVEMAISLDITGEPLPSAREISNIIHREGDVMEMDPVLSVMVMQWGQFLEHDILSVPVYRGRWILHVLHAIYNVHLVFCMR
jgi:hypothetical protein